jgi:hypothetical protein
MNASGIVDAIAMNTSAIASSNCGAIGHPQKGAKQPSEKKSHRDTESHERKIVKNNKQRR